MRFKTIDWLRAADEELIAAFGEARLVRDLDGRFELRGGTPADRRAAKEYVGVYPMDIGRGTAGHDAG